MSFFQQTPQNGLAIVNGNLRVSSDAPSHVACKLSVRYQFRKGEWFKNLDEGLPRERVYGKISREDQARTFREVAAKCPGVARVLNVSLDYDPTTRTLKPLVEVRTVTGAVIVGGAEAFTVRA